MLAYSFPLIGRGNLPIGASLVSASSKPLTLLFAFDVVYCFPTFLDQQLEILNRQIWLYFEIVTQS